MFAFLCVIIALELFGHHLCGDELLYTRHLRHFCFCDFKFCVRRTNISSVLRNGCNLTPRKRFLILCCARKCKCVKTNVRGRCILCCFTADSVLLYYYVTVFIHRRARWRRFVHVQLRFYFNGDTEVFMFIVTCA